MILKLRPKSYTGIGMAGIEIVAQVIVQKSFQKKRLLANGIATSGTGFGMIVMAPVVEMLLSTYGLKGTFLILCAICLNGIVFGLLFPSDDEYPSAYSEKKYDKLVNERSNATTDVCDETSDHYQRDFISKSENEKHCKKGQNDK